MATRKLSKIQVDDERINRWQDHVIGTLNPVLDRVFASQAWQTPQLLNGWVNFGAPNADAGFYRDAIGIVHIQGTIKNGIMPSAAFQLPAGYRPLGTLAFPVDSGGGYAQLLVNAAGFVGPNVGGTLAFHLDGVSFRAEQ